MHLCYPPGPDALLIWIKLSLQHDPSPPRNPENLEAMTTPTYFEQLLQAATMPIEISSATPAMTRIWLVNALS